MQRLLRIGVIALAAMAPVSGAMAAELRVFTCEPEWAALAEEIGGGRVEAVSATHAAQDVHYIQARPSLISKLRRADLLVCTGAGLEAGWLPVLLRRANNPDVQPGTPGHLLAADVVPMLDVPKAVDRARGDMHAEGNPHLQLDPHNILRVAEALAERLGSVDPDGAEIYRDAFAAFRLRWQAAIEAWETRGRALQGMRVVAHHQDWRYLADWLDLEIVAKLEPLPGVPPTSAHLAALLASLEERPVTAILRTSYQDGRPAEWLSERSGAPVLVLPHTVSEEAPGLEALFDTLLSRLEAVAP